MEQLEQRQEATSHTPNAIMGWFSNMSFTDGGRLQNALLPSVVPSKQIYSPPEEEDCPATKTALFSENLKRKKVKTPQTC